MPSLPRQQTANIQVHWESLYHKNKEERNRGGHQTFPFTSICVHMDVDTHTCRFTHPHAHTYTHTKYTHQLQNQWGHGSFLATPQQNHFQMLHQIMYGNEKDLLFSKNSYVFLYHIHFYVIVSWKSLYPY